MTLPTCSCCSPVACSVDGSDQQSEHALRAHRYFSRTLSTCPVCHRVLRAKLVEKGGKAYLDKECPEHGAFFNLVSSSFQYYVNPGAPLVQGRIPGHFSTTVNDGCPQDCGYCPQHEQHACVALIEITGHCNMSCPICYADPTAGEDITLGDFSSRLDTVEKVEGRIDVLQLSGGEPTLHPQLIEFLRETARRRPNRILLNTNGRRMATDDAFLARLAEFRDVLDIYLQYDGPSPAAAQRLRACDLRAEKDVVIEKLAAVGLNTILVVTLCSENLPDVPEIVRLAARTPGITGLTFQTMTYCGRNEGAETVDRITTPDVIREMTRLDWLEPRDIFPLPCSHPYCTQLTFLHCRPGRNPFPLIRLSEVGAILDVIKNRLSFGRDTISALDSHLRGGKGRKRPRLRELGAFMAARRFFRQAKGSAWNGEKVLRIMIKQFMDAETFDVSRATRCCVAVVTEDGRMIPFCNFNTIHRERTHVSGH